MLSAYQLLAIFKPISQNFHLSFKLSSDLTSVEVISLSQWAAGSRPKDTV